LRYETTKKIKEKNTKRIVYHLTHAQKMASEQSNGEQSTNAADDEHATGADAQNDRGAAVQQFLQASAELLLNISPPLESSLPPPSAMPVNDALLLLAQSVMEAQAPRPTFSDFASVPAENPFGSPPVADS
jgi:hypothetical protein